MIRYVIIGIFVILGVGGFVFALWSAFMGIEDTPLPVEQVSLPEAPVVQQGDVLVPTTQGGTMAVHDVRFDRGVTSDEIYPEEGRRFVFAIHRQPEKPVGYQLLFYEKSGEFLVTLFGEPLAFTRGAAERELLARLGIRQADACNLLIRVQVLDGVRPELDEKDIGLSFCPGATLITDL